MLLLSRVGRGGFDRLAGRCCLDGRLAQAALPVLRGRDVERVIVFSTTLEDVQANVDLVPLDAAGVWIEYPDAPRRPEGAELRCLRRTGNCLAHARFVEAARAMGATPFQIIRKVLIPEALPGITLGLTLAVVSLIGYSAMVGAVGGQGLGDLGIRYGYQRFMPEVMAAVVVILIVLVQLVQSLGEWIAARVDRRAPRNRGA